MKAAARLTFRTCQPLCMTEAFEINLLGSTLDCRMAIPLTWLPYPRNGCGLFDSRARLLIRCGHCQPRPAVMVVSGFGVYDAVRVYEVLTIKLFGGEI